MREYKLPIVVLDRAVHHFADALRMSGFTVLKMEKQIIDDLEALVGGRVFLTTRPKFGELQRALNFDMVVIPAGLEPEFITNILSKWIELKQLWKRQPPWRLDVDEHGNVTLAHVEE